MAIKGTSRRVIEVPGTNSCYFEKAVLYVRPECSPIEDSRLTEEARLYTAGLSEYAAVGKTELRRKKLLSVLLKISAVLLAAAIALAIYALSL